jgi:hypothetical protein
MDEDWNPNLWMKRDEWVYISFTLTSNHNITYIKGRMVPIMKPPLKPDGQ